MDTRKVFTRHILFYHLSWKKNTHHYLSQGELSTTNKYLEDINNAYSDHDKAWEIYHDHIEAKRVQLDGYSFQGKTFYTVFEIFQQFPDNCTIIPQDLVDTPYIHQATIPGEVVDIIPQ